MPDIETGDIVVGAVRPVPLWDLMHRVTIIGVTGYIGSGKSYLCKSVASTNTNFVHVSVDEIIGCALGQGGDLTHQALRVFGSELVLHANTLMRHTGYDLDSNSLSARVRIDKAKLRQAYFDKRKSGLSKVWDNITYDYVIGKVVAKVLDIAAARSDQVILLECAMASFFERLSHECTVQLSQVLSVVRDKDEAVQSAVARGQLSKAEVLARYADQESESDLILSGTLWKICSQHPNHGSAKDVQRFASTLARLARQSREALQA